MTRRSVHRLPSAGELHVDGPPFVRRAPATTPLNTVYLIAAVLPGAAGVILFGFAAARVLVIATISAVVFEAAYHYGTLQTRKWSARFAIVIGLLFACTLPPDVSWVVVVSGTAVAVLIGEALPGGIGNYLWQPVALGRVAVQMLFHDQLTPARWPVLARGHLFFGRLADAAMVEPPMHWGSAPTGAEALLLRRPVDILRADIHVGTGGTLSEALSSLLCDRLPPWPDTLLGLTGGAIGEAAVVVVLLAAALLLWRGVLRWQTVFGAVLAAFVTIAICPVRLVEPEGPVRHVWFPVIAMQGHLPVGVAYVLYHLTAGGFLFVVCLLAADPTSSPLTWRGHVLFAGLLGALTMLLRVGVGLPAAAYWALLLVNTLVPIINRLTRRRVLGT